VLRAVGVGAGDRVLVDLADGPVALRAALATARLGAVVVTGAADAVRLDTLLAGTTPVAVVTGRHAEIAPAVAAADPRPGTLLAHGGHGPLDEQHELDWDVAMRAGRTDPAPTTQVPLGSAALVHWPADADGPAIRSVAEQLATVSSDPSGWDALLG
jgi:propionyl-CoA synthetase